MSVPNSSVLWSVQQTLTDAQKLQARQNIDAAKVTKTTNANPPVTSTISTLSIIADGRVQADGSEIGLMAPSVGQNDAGKVLVAQWSGSPGIGTAQWQDGNNYLNNVFIAIYGTTTYAEIGAAIAAGKAVLLKVANTKFIPLSRYVANSSAIFTSIGMEGNMITSGVQHYIVSSSGWSTSPSIYNGNDQTHLPSCGTANVTTHLQDTADDWLTVGRLKIGGMGTSGGGIDIMLKNAFASGNTVVQYHTVFRTNASSGGEDNTCTYGNLTLTQNSWSRLFAIGQYSGTNNVQCSLEADVWETETTTPEHYKITVYKYWDGSYTRLLISIRLYWGDQS
jgi:hypothetical protein